MQFPRNSMVTWASAVLCLLLSGCSDGSSDARAWDVVSGRGTDAAERPTDDAVAPDSGGEDDSDGDVPRGFEAVAAGHSSACAIRHPHGHADCWAGPKAETPALDYVDIGVGDDFACGIDGDRTLLCWGENGAGQADPPEDGTFRAVRAGYRYACAQRPDRTLECWGSSTFGQTEAPDGPFERFDTGYFHACGLRPNGTIECWGLGTDPERSEVESVSAPPGLAVDTDQAAAPSGRYRDVAAGGWHSCAVDEEGEVECWGIESDGAHQKLWFGQTEPPDREGTDLSAGLAHTCAGQYCFGLGSDAFENELRNHDLPDRFDAVADYDQSIATERDDGYLVTASGDAFTCGIDTHNSIVCWGKIDAPEDGYVGPDDPGHTDKEDTDPMRW